MRYLITAALLALVPAQSLAEPGDLSVEGYIEVGSDATGSVYYMHLEEYAETLSNRGYGSISWKVDHSRDFSVEARSSILRIEYRCPDRTMKIDGTASYNASGRLMARPAFGKEYSFSRQLDGTVGDTLLEYGCYDPKR